LKIAAPDNANPIIPIGTQLGMGSITGSAEARSE